MDQEPQIQPVEQQHAPTFHGFWPVLLLGASLGLVLSWEVWVGITTRRGAQQIEEHQVKVVEQSKQVQAGLEKLVRGLVELSKTDEAAQRLITKFGIKLNNPTVPDATPTP